MNSKPIADGLAARFVGVTATNGASTESIAIGPTASLPNSITKGPALLVYHPRGPVELGPSRFRNDRLTFPIRLLRDPMTYPQRSDWLYAWYDALRDRVEMNMDLDLPAYVAFASVEAIRIELDGEEYAGVIFDVVEMMTVVRIREVVSTVSI